ncbi:hypothetical protein [Methylocystis rosea]|uniref:hypothetical protein n=1 Tax=Methylocystis rosea TaxID=173366 RepID=UPI001FD9D826|nr:hypothetical protein [Methylocystis rosea]
MLRLLIYSFLLITLACTSEAAAQANVLKECGSQYQSAKTANELAGQSWQDFLKACRARLAERPAEAKPAEAVPASLAPAITYSHASASLASAVLAINASGYAFLYSRGSEASGYGLYSYAILRNGSQRSAALLKQIFTQVKDVHSLIASPAETNILFVPSTKEMGRRKQNDFYKNEGNIRRFLSNESKSSAHYSFAIAGQLIAAICNRPVDEVKSLCNGDETSGPYIVTYAKQIGNTSPLPPPFLLVDLTPVDESAFGTLVSSYLSQVQEEKFDDRKKIDTFRNTLLNLILHSARSLEPITAALLGIVHQVNATENLNDSGKK